MARWAGLGLLLAHAWYGASSSGATGRPARSMISKRLGVVRSDTIGWNGGLASAISWARATAGAPTDDAARGEEGGGAGGGARPPAGRGPPPRPPPPPAMVCDPRSRAA